MSRKRLPVWRTLLVMMADLVAIGVGLMFAFWLRFHSSLFDTSQGYLPSQYMKIFVWACLIWLLALRFENLYRRRSRIFDFNVVRRIVTGSFLAVLILIALDFFFRLGRIPTTGVGPAALNNNLSIRFSRLATIFVLIMVISSLLINRLILYYIFRWLLVHRGVGQSRTLIIGGGPFTQSLVERTLHHSEWGFRPVGVVLGRAVKSSPSFSGETPILGTIDQPLEEVIAAHHIDEVILVERELDREHLPDLLVQCERALAVFRIVPETTDLLLSGMTIETMDGVPLLGSRETPLQGWNAALKRMLDVAVASVGLILTSPLILLIAWGVRRQDHGPVFFRQDRMGLDGRRFIMYKFRSMKPGAENRSGPIFAQEQDPRCTPLGRVLRRIHLDELPQLYNVLRGDMSLVGPRPERPYFVDHFRDEIPKYMARHQVRSGITGWAQVNGLCGPRGTIRQRLQYDLYYIEHWTIWFDVKILIMTMLGWVKPGPMAHQRPPA